MKNIKSFFKKHGIAKGIGIIKRYLILKLIYEPFNVKRKWIKINGYYLLLDFETEGISEGLYVMGSREILETEVVKEVVKEGDVCLDVGANIGYYCFLEAVNTKSRIYVFEPDKRNIDILKKALKRNKFENINVYEMAMADKKGFQKMYETKASNLNTFVKQNNFKGKSVLIETTAVDEFLKYKDVDFIRMDIQGFEYEVFSGMDKLIKSKKPLKIMIEFHFFAYSKERDFMKKLQLLEKNNFKAKYLVTNEKPYAKLMKSKGYVPLKIVNDSPNIRALYKNIKIKDLIDLSKLDERESIVRAVLFERK